MKENRLNTDFNGNCLRVEVVKGRYDQVVFENSQIPGSTSIVYRIEGVTKDGLVWRYDGQGTTYYGPKFKAKNILIKKGCRAFTHNNDRVYDMLKKSIYVNFSIKYVSNQETDRIEMERIWESLEWEKLGQNHKVINIKRYYKYKLCR